MKTAKLVGTFGVWMSFGCTTSVVRHDVDSAARAQYPNCIEPLLDHRPEDQCGGKQSSGDPQSCFACQCREECGSDADCAPPGDSTAVGVCVDGECELQCDDDAQCPTGMHCTEWGDDETICMWATDDPFVCAEATEAAEPCESFTDAASCNAVASSQTDERCLWVESIIVSTAGESCEPAATQGVCARVLDGEGSCTDVDVCGSTRVLWNDLGAGTAEILALDCSLDVRSRPGTSCDFTVAAGIPLACACGCAD